jgi:PII-like signaling protein
MIEIVDSVDYMDRFLPLLDEMVSEGMVTLEDVTVIKYGKKPPIR